MPVGWLPRMWIVYSMVCGLAFSSVWSVVEVGATSAWNVPDAGGFALDGVAVRVGGGLAAPDFDGFH